MDFDLGNLLCMFDEGLMKLIRHLEAGYPDRALIRAKEMHKAVDRMKTHCAAAVGKEVVKKI